MFLLTFCPIHDFIIYMYMNIVICLNGITLQMISLINSTNNQKKKIQCFGNILVEGYLKA